MDKKITYKALASKVLAVCVENKYDWKVYIDAVAGINHELEFKKVADYGDKTSKELGCFLFPEMNPDNWRC